MGRIPDALAAVGRAAVPAAGGAGRLAWRCAQWPSSVRERRNTRSGSTSAAVGAGTGPAAAADAATAAEVEGLAAATGECWGCAAIGECWGGGQRGMEEPVMLPDEQLMRPPVRRVGLGAWCCDASKRVPLLLASRSRPSAPAAAPPAAGPPSAGPAARGGVARPGGSAAWAARGGSMARLPAPPPGACGLAAPYTTAEERRLRCSFADARMT